MEKYKYILLYTAILFFGIINYKKYSHNLQLKLWLYFVVYSFLNEIGSRYIIETYNVRAMILSNAWWSVNSFFYLFFFLSLIKSTKKKKYIIFQMGFQKYFLRRRNQKNKTKFYFLEESHP